MVTLKEKIDAFNDRLRGRINAKKYEIKMQTLTLDTIWEEFKERLRNKFKRNKNGEQPTTEPRN